MQRTIDLPDDLAQRLDTYLQEHPEETLFSLVKEALENKLTSSKTKPTWEETLERIEARRKKIHARTGGKPFKPSVTEIIHQMRDERDEQLMQACCPPLEE
jgi:predicted DNA-binding protein